MAFRYFLFTADETIFTLVFKRVKKKATILLFLQPFSNLKHLEVFVLSLFLSFFFFFVSVLNVFWKLWVCLKEGPWIEFVVSNHKSNKK